MYTVYPNVDDHFSPMFGRQASPSRWPINKSPATGLQRVNSGEHGSLMLPGVHSYYQVVPLIL